MTQNVFRMNPSKSVSILLGSFCLFSAVSRSASAATFTVTTTADGVSGSLRERIESATAFSTINFAITGTISLTNQISITKNIIISGPGAGVLAVSAQSRSRIFTISAGAVVNISGITVTGGRIKGTDGATVESTGSGTGSEGETVQGGAILNYGLLTLNNSIVSQSTVTGGDGGYDPAYVYQGGTASG